MAFRKMAGLTVALLFSMNLAAEELQLNPQHPEQYTVVPHDTLWDISAKFLKSPWQWTKLWHGNPQIKNPHWIYPGDVLQLVTINGKHGLRLARSGKEVGLHPRIRTQDLDQEIKTIPTDAISQFLSSPQVLDTDDLENQPYVIDFPNEHLVTGAGDKIYVRSVLNASTLNYTVYRKGEPYISPETGEILGYEAIYIATAGLEKEGDPATLTIAKSVQEVRLGDRLMPTPSVEASLNYFPKPPDPDIRGNIIRVLNGVTQIGRFNIVVIDKGLTDGLKAGDVLTIHRKGKIVVDPFKSKEEETVMVKLPDEKAGSLMVFRPFTRVSYALVMEATQAIHVLDKVQKPEEN